jgi:hypothetical protein
LDIRQKPTLQSQNTLLALSINTKEALSARNKLADPGTPKKFDGKGQKLKQNISRIFRGKSHLLKSSNSSMIAQAHEMHLERNSNKFNITNLLPHKDALKDLKHVVHFSQFQNADSTTQVADGESFKILKHDMQVKQEKGQPVQIYMQVLDYYYNYNSLIAAYWDAAENSQAKDSFNRFFSPLSEKHLETDYLVRSI